MLLMLLLACAWEVPLDTGADPVLNAISGPLVVDGVSAPGPGFVLLYDADDPPPPAGVGSPVNLAAVSPDDFSGGGLLAGEYLLTGVPDGRYLLAGLVDMDGDFNPLLTASAGATCGDLVGAHVTDLRSGTPAELEVSGGVLAGEVALVAAAVLESERPAFTLTETTIDRASATPQTFQLSATGIESTLLTLDAPDDTEGCPALFLLWIVDDDGDGLPDPHPEPALAAAGAYDIWPRVYLRYQGDRDVVAEAVIDPSVLQEGYPVGDLTPLSALSVLYVPAAVETVEGGGQVVLSGAEVPAGAWSITVVNPTGQTWTIPNEVALYKPLAGASGDFQPEAQGASLVLE